jgi:hypothetical protein
MRQGARVSWFGLKTKVDGFSQFGLKTGGYGFPDMSLKIGNYSLVIWASKLPQWFPGLGYDLSVVPQNPRQDEDSAEHASRSSVLLHLEASQARFPSLASRLAEPRHRRCMWHHRGGRVEMKLKTDESM